MASSSVDDVASTVMRSSPTIPTTFEQFPNLPLEIRLKIYNLMIQPRTVHLTWNADLHRCISKDVPIIMQISHESREEGLRTYEPFFGTKSDFDSKPAIYFNCELDMVLLDGETCQRLHTEIPYEELSRIKRAKVQSRYLSQSTPGRSPWMLESLQELQIYGCGDREGGRQLRPSQFWVDIWPHTKARIISTGPPAPMLVCCEGPDLGVGIASNCWQHFWFEDWNKEIAGHSLPEWVEYIRTFEAYAHLG